jgi:hypothetical protein
VTGGLVESALPHSTPHHAYVFISDTIMLWCDEHGDVDSFVEVCASVVANATGRGMFLRGAIAFGEAIIDPPSNTFLGQPIIDSHLAEQDQEWVGVGVHGRSDAVRLSLRRDNRYLPTVVRAWHRRWLGVNLDARVGRITTWSTASPPPFLKASRRFKSWDRWTGCVSSSG